MEKTFGDPRAVKNQHFALLLSGKARTRGERGPLRQIKQGRYFNELPLHARKAQRGLNKALKIKMQKIEQRRNLK